MCFFFFKQKTAYEMRSSGWSSDVCSSDLADHGAEHAGGAVGFQGLGQVLDLAVRFDQPGTLGNAHQGASGVEHVHEQEGQHYADHAEIGRASCRERVCQYV